MEKAFTKMGSIKAGLGSSWITKRAKEEIKDISDDLSIFSNTVEQKAKWIFEKLKGKQAKSLPDLLREYNLPAGIFPYNIVCFEFEDTKSQLIVHFAHPCEISFKDGSVVRYATRVKAVLLRGKLMGIEGMKIKSLVWVKVTSVAVEGAKSDKVWFTAGVKKSKPKNAYDVPQYGLRVEDF